MSHILLGLKKQGRKVQSAVVVYEDGTYKVDSSDNAEPAHIRTEDLSALKAFITVFHGEWNWTVRKV